MGRSTLLLAVLLFPAVGCSAGGKWMPPPKPQVLYWAQPDDTWEQADPLPRDTPLGCTAMVPSAPPAPAPEVPDAP